MKNRWSELSYNKFPSFQTNFQRSAYEQWYDNLDDVESLIFELEEREDSAWIRKANTCVFIGHSLLL